MLLFIQIADQFFSPVMALHLDSDCPVFAEHYALNDLI